MSEKLPTAEELAGECVVFSDGPARIRADRLAVAKHVLEVAEHDVLKLRHVLGGSPQDYVTHAVAAIRALSDRDRLRRVVEGEE